MEVAESGTTMKKKKNEVNCIFARSLGKERKVVKTAKKAGSAM